MMLITQRVPPEFMYIIKDKPTSYDKLKNIEATFAKDATVSPAYALQSLFNYCWDEKKVTLLDFFAEIEKNMIEL